MASRILDLGDVLTLIEQAEKNWDKDEAARMAKKFADQEDFTLDDFLAQMQQIRNMGSMKKMLMMMPGAQNIRQQLEQFDEREIDRVEAIVRSMTPHERVAPKIINGSRRARIARGSGVHVSEVNGLLERFAQAQKMMKKMAAGGGMPGMPGMPGMGGGGARKGAKSGAQEEGPLRQPGQGRAGAQGRRGPAAAGAQGPSDRRGVRPAGRRFRSLPAEPAQGLRQVPRRRQIGPSGRDVAGPIAGPVP